MMKHPITYNARAQRAAELRAYRQLAQQRQGYKPLSPLTIVLVLCAAAFVAGFMVMVAL